MRYITIPKDATFKTRPNPKKDPKDEKEPTTYPAYPFSDYLKIDINSDARWFSDSEWEKAFDDVCTAFENVKPGDVVELNNAAHEKLELVVRAIPSAPDLKPALRFFVRAITQADKIDPRPPSN
jgi:hypothetical protein